MFTFFAAIVENISTKFVMSMKLGFSQNGNKKRENSKEFMWFGREFNCRKRESIFIDLYFA